jgi:hypothetical protein
MGVSGWQCVLWWASVKNGIRSRYGFIAFTLHHMVNYRHGDH